MLEQITLLMLVASGIIVMGPYVMKGWNAALKSVDDSVKEAHLDPLRDGSMDSICSDPSARRDGEWSGWSPPDCMSVCDVDCGVGTCTQTRTCTAPSPRCGGAYCVGANSQTLPCDAGCCEQDGSWIGWDDVNLKWSEDDVYWTPWLACIDCRRYRTKTQADHCVYPDPSCKGDPCPSPVPTSWDYHCGDVDGQWVRTVDLSAAGCVNCERTVQWECVSQCEGQPCECDAIDISGIPDAFRPPTCPPGTSTRQTQQISIPCDSPTCFSGYTCVDQYTYYGSYSCQAGECKPVLTDIRNCPDPEELPGSIDECMIYSDVMCVGGNVDESMVCTPQGSGPVENEPKNYCEVVDTGTRPVSGTGVHCSGQDACGFRTSWYDQKYCIDGGCSGFDPADEVDCTASGDGIDPQCACPGALSDPEGDLVTCTTEDNNQGCLIQEPNQCDPLDLAQNWKDAGDFCRVGDFVNTQGFRCNYEHHCADAPEQLTHWYDGFSCQPIEPVPDPDVGPTQYDCTGNYGIKYRCSPADLAEIQDDINSHGGEDFDLVCVDDWTPSQCDPAGCATSSCCTDYEITFKEGTECGGPLCIDDMHISDTTECSSGGACDVPIGNHDCEDVLASELTSVACECKGATVECDEGAVGPGDDECTYREGTTSCWLHEQEVCLGDCPNPGEYDTACCGVGQVWVNVL